MPRGKSTAAPDSLSDIESLLGQDALATAHALPLTDILGSHERNIEDAIERIQGDLAEDEARVVTAQMEAVDRAQMALAGIADYELWKRLDDDTKMLSIAAAADKRAGRDGSQVAPEPAYETLPEAALQGGAAMAEFARRQRELARNPTKRWKTHTIMCDPPVTWNGQKYHPDTSEIAIKDMPRKRKAGFSVTPQYDFLPKPSIPCGLGSEIGLPCPMLTRTPEELETHQRHWHREEYQARQESERQRKIDAEIARMEEQTAAIKAQGEAMTKLLERLAVGITPQE